MLKFELEHTDTFNGEANYSWVHRETINTSDDVTDRQLVRRAKLWAGLTGRRCRVENRGDTIAIYPQGLNQVLFVAYVEPNLPCA